MDSIGMYERIPKLCCQAFLIRIREGLQQSTKALLRLALRVICVSREEKQVACRSTLGRPPSLLRRPDGGLGYLPSGPGVAGPVVAEQGSMGFC